MACFSKCCDRKLTQEMDGMKMKVEGKVYVQLLFWMKL